MLHCVNTMHLNTVISYVTVSLLLFMFLEGKCRLINTWHMQEGLHLLLMMYTNVIQSP